MKVPGELFHLAASATSAAALLEELRARLPLDPSGELFPFGHGEDGLRIAGPLDDASRAMLRALARAVGGALARLSGPAARRERLRSFLEPFADAMWVYDLTASEWAYVSDGVWTLRGYDPTEIVGTRDPLWTSQSLPYFEQLLPLRVERFRAGERHRYVDEGAQEHKDGSPVWTENVTWLMEDEADGHLLVCGISRPTEPPPNDARAASGQTSLLEELQRVAKIGSWTVDVATGFARWSAELRRIHDLAPDAMLSAEELSRQCEPADRERILHEIERVIATGEPLEMELPIVTTTGARKWIRACARPIVESGEVIRIRGTTQDITRQKRAELELGAEQARLQSLLDHLPDLVVLEDLDGRVLACNARVASLYGGSAEALVGKRLHDGESWTRAEPRSSSGDEWLTFADGHRELVESFTAPVRGPTGDVVGRVRIGHDVTAIREAADELRAGEERLRVAQKMEAVGRLAGGVAHDFNNLLTVIMSYANLVQDSLPPASECVDDVREILSASRRAESLTRQLLAFSRRQLLQPKPTSLNDVLDTLGKMLRRLIGEHIELVVRPARSSSLVIVDRGQIEQVITNLVVNARDAMPSGGRITLGTADVELGAAAAKDLELGEGRYVEMSVEDTGTGMDDATMARIFEPFFTTKRVGEGTGLGLSMAYGIVKQSGGGIAVQSAVGAGTAFRIYFPAHDGSAATTSSAPPTKPARGHETVLVVEDEPKLRGAVRRILERAGYAVLDAGNAEGALSMASAPDVRVDLVFTDVVMPGMGGADLVLALRKMHPRMKVIFTSGYSDHTLARRGLDEECFVAKPYDPMQLTKTVRTVLG